MKDSISSDYILNIAKINKDKNYVIVEVLFPLASEDTVIYAAPVPNKYNYFVRIKINAIDSIKINSIIELNDDIDIEYKESKYLNSNNIEVVTKWADESQFDFSKFLDKDLPSRKRS